MSDDKNNIYVMSYGAAVPSASLSVQQTAVPNFFRSAYGANMYLSFGSTAGKALREMAEGLETEGISHIEGLSLHYDPEADLEEDLYCVTAYIYQPHAPED